MPKPTAPTPLRIPIPQPRLVAGNSSLITTNDGMAGETVKLRVAICTRTNWTELCGPDFVRDAAKKPRNPPGILTHRTKLATGCAHGRGAIIGCRRPL